MIAASVRSPVFWFRLVSLVAVVSVALGLARLTWRLVGWDDGRETVWTPATLAPVGGATGGAMVSILAWSPFGGATVEAGGLPISNLGLVLRGVIYAAGGGSTALISNGGGPVQAFAVGQAPVGNAVIEAIDIESVILSVGGRREVLLLPRPTAATPLAATPSGGAAIAAPSAQPSTMAPGQSADARAALAAASPIATAAAAAARQTPAPAAAAAATPSAAVGSLGVSATAQGYVIGPDSAPQLLRAGLRRGDVIKSLNGRPLGNPDSDQQLLQGAAATGRARVEVLRDGRTLTLTIPLR